MDLSGHRSAEVALELYGLTGASLTFFKENKRVSLFRVSSRRRGNFLLRSYVPTQISAGARRDARSAAISSLFSEAALESQALWLSDLRKTERLPVPEPVPTVDGSFIGTTSLDEFADRRLFLLLRWIPGQQKEGIDLTVKEAHDLGSYIARLHLHAERFSPPERFFRPRWDWNSLFDESAPYWRQAEVVLCEKELVALHSLIGRIGETLQAVGEAPDQFGMIHRDLHTWNIVFHEGVLYAIDFDHCGWGHYMYDLARTYLYFEELGDRCRQMQEAILEGYQSQRPLPNDPHSAMEMFVNMHRMNKFILALARLERSRSAETSISPTRKSALLTSTVDSLMRAASNGAE